METHNWISDSALPGSPLVLQNFLKVAASKKSARWYGFGLDEDDPHSMYSFCRCPREKLDKYMVACGFMFWKKGALSVKGDVLKNLVAEIQDVEHDLTKVHSFGYPDKKFHWFRIGSIPNKGKDSFTIKEQLAAEQKDVTLVPRRPRESKFHLELLDHIDLTLEVEAENKQPAQAADAEYLPPLEE